MGKKTKESCLSPADLVSSSLYQLVKPESISKEKKETPEMDVEMNDAAAKNGSGSKTTKSFGKTDKNGQYPVWMSQRNVKRLQKQNGKKKTQKKRNKAQK